MNWWNTCSTLDHQKAEKSRITVIPQLLGRIEAAPIALVHIVLLGNSFLSAEADIDTNVGAWEPGNEKYE